MLLGLWPFCGSLALLNLHPKAGPALTLDLVLNSLMEQERVLISISNQCSLESPSIRSTEGWLRGGKLFKYMFLCPLLQAKWGEVSNSPQ